MDNLRQYLSHIAMRRYVRVVAFAVLGACTGFLIMSFLIPFLESTTKEYIGPSVEVTQESIPTTTASLPRSAPTVLRIPKMNFEAEFEEPLELNPDRTIEIPDSYEKVGWYGLGASPGEKGPAVILGHVDSYQGPAIFYSLGKLEPGDTVYVDRADGTTATFVVYSAQRYSQDEFPTEKVYGMTADAELRLITCTGKYDRGEQRYSHNLVVYATLTNESD